MWVKIAKHECEIKNLIEETLNKEDPEGINPPVGKLDEYHQDAKEIYDGLFREGPCDSLAIAKIIRTVLYYNCHCWTIDELPDPAAYLPVAIDVYNQIITLLMD